MAQQIQLEQKQEQESQQKYDETIQEIVRLTQEEEEELDQKRRRRKKLQNFLANKGIILSYTYHCNRCNYTWFPKDFDNVLSDIVIGGSNLIHMTPPKSCARCKSKYWNSPPKRKTQHTSVETTSLSLHKVRSDMGSKMQLFGHDMVTIQRMRADHRRTKKGMDQNDKEIKRLRDYAKKRGFKLNV